MMSENRYLRPEVCAEGRLRVPQERRGAGAADALAEPGDAPSVEQHVGGGDDDHDEHRHDQGAERVEAVADDVVGHLGGALLEGPERLVGAGGDVDVDAAPVE